MSPKQLAIDIRTAYEARDRDALERALQALMEKAEAAEPPPPVQHRPGTRLIGPFPTR